MSNIKQIIQEHLLNVDAKHFAERRKVYEKIWNAQEHYLITLSNVEEHKRSQKRNELTQIIQTIEQEYRLFNNQKLKHAPQQIRPRSSQAIPQNESAISKVFKHSKRHFFSIYFIFWALLFIVFSFIIWSFYNSFLTPRLDIATVIAPEFAETVVRPVQEHNLNSKGWVRIFNPQDAIALEVEGSAKAKIFNDGKESFVRLDANTINDVAILNIGSGALKPMRDKTVIIDIIARSSTSDSSNLVVTCDFGHGNDCGRIRFELTPIREDLLLKVKIPADFHGEGKLRVSSDRISGGRGVDIYSVLIKSTE